MREPNYSEAFSHSWQMVKEHKILWVFGLLSVCLGQWGLANFLGGLNMVGLNQYGASWHNFSSLFLLLQIAGEGVIPFLLVLWLFVVGAALFILMIFVAVVARGALIAAVGHWFAKDGKVSLALVWRHGVKNFWKLLVLVILTRLFEVALLISALGVFALCGNSTAGFISQAFFGALALAVGIALEAVMIFASGYVVIDGESVSNSIARAWRLFTRHILITLELGVLLTVASLLVAVVVILAGSLVLIPAMIVWLFAILTGLNGLFSFGFILAWVLFVMVIGLAAAIFNAFNTSVWMYLFVKMHRESYVGWVLNTVKKLFSK
ncbi:MAG: hypothetical protein A3J93_02985 [Candidatus Magasanikbacteria bacterium RIFOXYC2_FULL_42_28]|uniref:Glycerophosphoryl diester phosphodiesterase membrane domain-containing protein n=1 Tax=Candidatus Magasanikbacteria bacterium RIFOXYC2_FULL_42_28 TaxID=1798704 RepID=A0A1F6NUS5_9BACT|nr:MAG: hypothetical protein A3J93_02985 [Candidatus Magasanikbacteria bacterium RIFOXYC2_FULL_42_28]